MAVLYSFGKNLFFTHLLLFSLSAQLLEFSYLKFVSLYGKNNHVENSQRTVLSSAVMSNACMESLVFDNNVSHTVFTQT